MSWSLLACCLRLLSFCRRGADRTIRDYEDMLPRDYAEQRGHTECVKLLQNYGHRRPLSAASHVGLPPPTTTPTLDEHGHIMLKNPTRRFSLSGESMTSFEHRLPADGQAQTEGGGEELERSGGLTTQSSIEHDARRREAGEGGHTYWADSRQPRQVRFATFLASSTGPFPVAHVQH